MVPFISSDLETGEYLEYEFTSSVLLVYILVYSIDIHYESFDFLRKESIYFVFGVETRSIMV